MSCGFGGTTLEAPLVGRDDELRRLGELVEPGPRAGRFVVISGDAGVGRTALWRRQVERHRAAGHTVLVTCPARQGPAEALRGLADLFGGVEGGTPTFDPLLDRDARGRAVLDVLRREAGRAPVLVAVDDVEWLDASSAAALRYGLRRLLDERVDVLAVERTRRARGAGAPAVPADRREELRLGPLTIDGTRGVLAGSGISVPRPVLRRIHDLAAGYPRHVLDLGRAVEHGGVAALTSVPTSVREAVRAALDGAPADVWAVVRVAAALGPATTEAIARCAPVADARSSITRSLERGLLDVGDDLVVRFAHPLLALAVLSEVAPADRRRLHALVADHAADPDARARHRALARTEPDAAVAGELDAASHRAAQRGDPALAAELAEHGVRLTPASDDAGRSRRAIAAVLQRAAAGDRATALERCDTLLAEMPAGPRRAEVVTFRALLDLARADRFLAQGLAEAGDDELLRGRILELRGWLAMNSGTPRRGLALTEQALGMARELADPTLEMLAASSTAAARLMVGSPAPELMDRALDLARRHPPAPLVRWPQGTQGQLCLWGGRLDEARHLLGELDAHFVRSGMDFQRPYRLMALTELEIAAGDLVAARRRVDEGLDIAVDTGNSQALALLAHPAGIVDVHTGEGGRAREAAAVLRRRARGGGAPMPLMRASHLAGLADLAAGRADGAVRELEVGLGLAREAGYVLPSIVPLLPEAIEASLRAGDADRCGALADELQRQADAVAQPWVTAAARRGGALAALATGADGACDALGDVAEAFARLGYRLDAARTRLVQGEALRAAGRRNPAADVLATAHAELGAIGATAWQRRAAAELERVAPGRRDAQLTPAEQRVADRVALGRRNREIADDLCVSVPTVEAHLTRIYRKMDVRSRTELARALRREDDTVTM